MGKKTTLLSWQDEGLTCDVKVMASDSFFDGVSDGSQGSSVTMTTRYVVRSI